MTMRRMEYTCNLEERERRRTNLIFFLYQTVSQAGEVCTVRGGKRVRHNELQEGENTISISLWEEHTGVPEVVSQRVEVTPVVVSEFNNRKRLESTATMKLQAIIDNVGVPGRTDGCL